MIIEFERAGCPEDMILDECGRCGVVIELESINAHALSVGHLKQGRRDGP
jgi:hypothetical protein